MDPFVDPFGLAKHQISKTYTSTITKDIDTLQDLPPHKPKSRTLSTFGAKFTELETTTSYWLFFLSFFNRVTFDFELLAVEEL
jgi:hypothetical protein